MTAAACLFALAALARNGVLALVAAAVGERAALAVWVAGRRRRKTSPEAPQGVGHAGGQHYCNYYRL